MTERLSARACAHRHTHLLRALHEHGVVLDAMSYTEMSDSSLTVSWKVYFRAGSDGWK